MKWIGGREGGGLFCQFPQWDVPMMHEVCLGKVMSHHTIQAEYLTKRQKRGGGGFSADLHQVEVLPVEYSSLS